MFNHFLMLYKKIKSYDINKTLFHNLCAWNPTFGFLEIGHKLEKRQWPHNFLKWSHCKVFWRCFVFLMKFSYWSKFHVNIITGSGVMTIFFYKGLTRNPEVGNAPIWVLPDISRLGHVKDIKLSMTVSNKTLLKDAKWQGYSFYFFCVIKRKPTGGVKLPLIQIRVNSENIIDQQEVIETMKHYHCTRNHTFFFQMFWKDDLSKKIALEYDLSCIIRKDDISFFRKYHLIL